jgi:hypothetical protein
VLSHGPCSLTKKRIVIDYEAFREAGQEKFFEGLPEYWDSDRNGLPERTIPEEVHHS